MPRPLMRQILTHGTFACIELFSVHADTCHFREGPCTLPSNPYWKMPGKAYIGTSGWNYKSWRNAFYRDTPQKHGCGSARNDSPQSK